METDTTQLIRDRDNAIQQIKKAVPDYPWDDNPPAPMSEAAYAACSTIEGIRLANDDWRKRAQELAEALQGLVDSPVAWVNGYKAEVDAAMRKARAALAKEKDNGFFP